MAFSDISFSASDFDPLLKDYYEPAVQDVLNSKTILLYRISRDEESVSGRQVIAALRIGRNEGMGFIGSGGTLPDPGQQKWANRKFDVQLGYHRYMFPGPEMAQARNDRGAFLRLMDSELRNGITDNRVEYNRIMYGNGSGALCSVKSNAADPTLTVENPGGYANTSNGTLYLREGMVLIPVSAAGSTAGRTSRKITSIDPTNETVTFDGATGASNGDYLVRASESGKTAPPAINVAYNNEPFGLRALADTGNPPTRNLNNIDATANTWWRGIVKNNGGVARPLTLDLLQETEDELDIWADGTPTVILSSHPLRRAYIDLLESQKRFLKPFRLDGGWRAVAYNDVPWVVDKDCPDGLIYMIDESVLRIYQMSDIFFINRDGSILQRDLDRDMYQATTAHYWEFSPENRKPLARIDDLAS